MADIRAEGHPRIELYQVLPGAPAPTPAGENAVLSLPSKALRFCPPVVGATQLGWYVYPPMDIALRFDGQQTDWRDAQGTWHRVVPGDEGSVEDWAQDYQARYPAAFREALPDDVPGLFNADPRAPHRVEMYSGVVARTTPGWSLLVRQPANHPGRTDMVVYEGVIETSWAVAMLPTIVELTTPGAVVELRTAMPLAQIQLVPDDLLYGRTTATIGWLEDIPEDLWDQWQQTRARRTGQGRPGSYHRESRRLRRLPSEDETTQTAER